MRENLDDEITEVKSETAIDRITSQANPRTLERVPAGARFKVRMVLDVLCDEDKALAARLFEGLRLLEDDALGGGGSRGAARRVRIRQSQADVARTWISTRPAPTNPGKSPRAISANICNRAVNDSSFAEKLAE